MQVCTPRPPAAERARLRLCRPLPRAPHPPSPPLLQERAIMGDANHPYITKLFATFKNDVYLYMLLEVSLGGELFGYRMMTEEAAAFYSACIVRITTRL